MFSLLLLLLCLRMREVSADSCTDGECLAVTLLQSDLMISRGSGYGIDMEFPFPPVSGMDGGSGYGGSGLGLISQQPSDGSLPHMSQNISRNMASSTSGSCANVILLSPGRTASDTISGTVVASSPLEYCHEKETYRMDSPTRDNLLECSRNGSNKGGSFVHAKPEHITFEKGLDLALNPSHSSEAQESIDNSDLFFKVARDVGFTVVVTSFRDNQLAREVSSFELSNQAKPGTSEFTQHAREAFGPKLSRGHKNLIEQFEYDIRRFNRAVQAARRNNFQMIAITFDEIVSDVCGTTMRVAAAAGCGASFHCKEMVGHTDTSHHGLGLEGRIGFEAAQYVTSLLRGTAYEWMLDLRATKWPSQQRPPVEVEH